MYPHLHGCTTPCMTPILACYLGFFQFWQQHFDLLQPRSQESQGCYATQTLHSNLGFHDTTDRRGLSVLAPPTWLPYAASLGCLPPMCSQMRLDPLLAMLPPSRTLPCASCTCSNPLTPLVRISGSGSASAAASCMRGCPSSRETRSTKTKQDYGASRGGVGWGGVGWHCEA